MEQYRTAAQLWHIAPLPQLCDWTIFLGPAQPVLYPSPSLPVPHNPSYSQHSIHLTSTLNPHPTSSLLKPPQAPLNSPQPLSLIPHPSSLLGSSILQIHSTTSILITSLIMLTILATQVVATFEDQLEGQIPNQIVEYHDGETV